MIKFIALVSLVVTRVFFHPIDTNPTTAPFASLSQNEIVPAKILSANAEIKNNKVLLNWNVSENETADQFEVEKSTDGINFKFSALVFGSEKTKTERYQFFEKVGKKKMLYRIKLINKNKEIEYSSILEINPEA